MMLKIEILIQIFCDCLLLRYWKSIGLNRAVCVCVCVTLW